MRKSLKGQSKLSLLWQVRDEESCKAAGPCCNHSPPWNRACWGGMLLWEGLGTTWWHYLWWDPAGIPTDDAGQIRL